MGEKLFDDLARALVEPMPRRRAVRLLGTSLVAVLVPGVRPLVARAGTLRSATCGPDVRTCSIMVQGAFVDWCCPGGSPTRRYVCDGDLYNPHCSDTCDGPNDNPCTGPKDKDGLSEFHCCEKPSRCIDGSCGPVCRWKRSRFDDEEVAPYDPKTQCCSSTYGVNPKDGDWIYVACKSTLRPKPNYKPAVNGCGTKKFKVSDVWPPESTKKYKGPRAQWRKVCNKHDRCYSTCGADKDACDKAFCLELNNACDEAFGKNARMLSKCEGEAAIYCAGVKLAGDGAFKNAQREACFCC